MSVWDIIIAGDEVESILTAVSAARCGAQVCLIRASEGKLGGLSTRGGLAYMDITPEFISPLFGEFLKRAGVVRVALAPDAAHQALGAMLDESGVSVLSGMDLRLKEISAENGAVLENIAGHTFRTRRFIDATPDADFARAAGTPFIKGLGSLLGEERNYLGVSPVFTISGVPREGLIAFEASLRETPELADLLKTALPHLTPEQIEAYRTRPVYSPDDQDYIDILNPTIGVMYHRWRHGDVSGYSTAEIWIDGANIARLPNNLLAFNGMIMRLSQDENTFEHLLTFSQGNTENRGAPKTLPKILTDELAAFEKFLRVKGGFTEAAVIAPDMLYVRQTLTLLSRNNMTAADMIRGGVSKEHAIGTYSYWLDLRGAELWRHFPGEGLPKPVFNVGLDVSLPPTGPAYRHLSPIAFVGRSAGYSPIGQGAGRIVQHNAMVGESLGIAAALSVQEGSTLQEISAERIREVLSQRAGTDIHLSGHPTQEAAAIESSSLLKQDSAIVEALRTEAFRKE